jgi:hypothetical protein
VARERHDAHCAVRVEHLELLPWSLWAVELDDDLAVESAGHCPACPSGTGADQHPPRPQLRQSAGMIAVQVGEDDLVDLSGVDPDLAQARGDGLVRRHLDAQVLSVEPGVAGGAAGVPVPRPVRPLPGVEQHRPCCVPDEDCVDRHPRHPSSGGDDGRECEHSRSPEAHVGGVRGDAPARQ